MKKWTYIGSLAAIFLWSATHILDLDFFEHLIAFQHQMEASELDELLLFLSLPILGLLADLVIRRNAEALSHEVETHRLNAMRSTLATLEDTIGNELVALRFLPTKDYGQETVPIAMHDELNKILDDAQRSLIQLGNLTTVHEKQVVPGFAVIDIDRDVIDKDSTESLAD